MVGLPPPSDDVIDVQSPITAGQGTQLIILAKAYFQILPRQRVYKQNGLRPCMPHQMLHLTLEVKFMEPIWRYTYILFNYKC